MKCSVGQTKKIFRANFQQGFGILNTRPNISHNFGASNSADFEVLKLSNFPSG